MGPSDYKPRRNNYRPLKELEQKNAREASEKEVTGKQVNQSVEQQREEEPQRPPLNRILERMPGGPDRGEMRTHFEWARAQDRVNNEALQAQRDRNQGPDRAASPPQHQRTPIKELVKQSAEHKQKISDPAIERKGPDIDRD